jgi:hypothetical protein
MLKIAICINSILSESFLKKITILARQIEFLMKMIIPYGCFLVCVKFHDKFIIETIFFSPFYNCNIVPTLIAK